MNALRRLFVEDIGAETVEYALVLGLLAIAAVVGLSAVGQGLLTFFNNLASGLPSGQIP